MIREGYPELIEYVKVKTGNSENKTWKVLKEYSTVIKESLKLGNTVKVEGLVEITFTVNDGDIYENKEYGLEDQIQDISKRLNLDYYEVQTIVVTYLKRMKDRVKDGYQVNLKGVCYLIPQKIEDGVINVPRLSPVLEKPEIVDYVVSTENGLYLKEYWEKDIRFKIYIEPEIEYINEIATIKQKEGLKLRKIDI